MSTIRIHKRIKSDTLKLPQLKKLIGRDVQIIILTDDEAGLGKVDKRFPLRGTAYEFSDPFSPAVDPDEWEANR